jgi:hypothetical protein
MLVLETCRKLLPPTARPISADELESLRDQMVVLAQIAFESVNEIRGAGTPKPKVSPRKARAVGAHQRSFQELIRSVPGSDQELIIERAAILEFEGGLSRKTAEDLALSEWAEQKLQSSKSEVD